MLRGGRRVTRPRPSPPAQESGATTYAQGQPRSIHRPARERGPSGGGNGRARGLPSPCNRHGSGGPLAGLIGASPPLRAPVGEVLPAFNPGRRTPSYTAPGPRLSPASASRRQGQEGGVLGDSVGSRREAEGPGRRVFAVRGGPLCREASLCAGAGGGVLVRGRAGSVIGVRPGSSPRSESSGTGGAPMDHDSAVRRAAPVVRPSLRRR